MRTWDCFLLNDEVEMLEIRLDLLHDVVDRFVIAEADHTHRGLPKTSCFAANRERFAPHLDKITHVTAVVPPAGAPGVETWDREMAQHAVLRRALEDVAAGDLVLVGDLDEIPFPEVVVELGRTLRRPTRLVMAHALHYANHVVPDPWEGGTKACRGDQLASDEMAVLLGHRPGPYLPPMPADPDRVKRPDSGWHLSFLGGPEAVRRKARASTHDFDAPLVLDRGHLRRCDRLGVGLLGWFRVEVREADDPIQSFVAVHHPHLVDRRTPRPLRSRLYHRWARLRLVVPGPVARPVDRLPGLAYVVGGAMIAVDRTRAGLARVRILRALHGRVVRR